MLQTAIQLKRGAYQTLIQYQTKQNKVEKL